MNEMPEGFAPLFRSSPYLDLLGPIYNKKTDSELRIGLKAEKNLSLWLPQVLISIMPDLQS